MGEMGNEGIFNGARERGGWCRG